MTEINLRNYAYLGDAVWELHVREKTIILTNNPQKLHKITTEFVKTHFQCVLLHEIENILTEEEQDIIRRARNLPIPVGRRNIQTEYRQATAFETLIGWWFKHDNNKLNHIYDILDKYLTN